MTIQIQDQNIGIIYFTTQQKTNSNNENERNDQNNISLEHFFDTVST